MEPFQCPSDIGRIPKKFSSSYGSFNADQYKNWTLLFSIYALCDWLHWNILTVGENLF